MKCSMISLDGVTKRFGEVTAVDDATLCVDRGEVVALLGPSGCGKTTLLRLVAGFERPLSGTVEVAGRLVAGSGTFVPPEDRRVGMVFQDYALFPHLTVAENVGFGLKRRQRGARVPELLAVVGLDGLGERFPHELSGGQQQRVALARALAPSPELVLLDEPWSNVDPFLRETLRSEVVEIIRPLGVTVVLVTHDREEAFSLADRIALMRNGAVVQEGTSEDLYFAPVSQWAAEFVGAANVLAGERVNGRIETPLGPFPAHDAPADARRVLVRPELLGLELDPAGAAEVVAREFRGHDVFYRVLLDGVELVSQRPSTEVVPLGSRVSIRVHEGRAPVLD
jgi:iron(III) transport system ATP-binding protein